MKKTIKPQKTLTALLAALTFLAFPTSALADTYTQTAASDGKTIICVDPGHGGGNTGTTFVYDLIRVMEKDITLEIARALREELLTYQNVEVVMTRETDAELGNSARMDYARTHYADYVVSVHINSSGVGVNQGKGCLAIVPVSNYQAPQATVPDVYKTSERMGLSVVQKLNSIGLPLSNELEADINRGLVRRPHNPTGGAHSTVTYPDGQVADYYGLVRRSVENGIPIVMIEHAFLDNEFEFRTYLGSTEQLHRLGYLDAVGIAEALGLQKIPAPEPESGAADAADTATTGYSGEGNSAGA